MRTNKISMDNNSAQVMGAIPCIYNNNKKKNVVMDVQINKETFQDRHINLPIKL